MNISELIQSTNQVQQTTTINEDGERERTPRYGAKNTFQNKPFGAIYFYNKLVTPKADKSILEISMLIKGVTEKVMAGKSHEKKPVEAHRVMIQISGVKQTVMSAPQLAQAIRKEHPELGDEEQFSDGDVIEMALTSNIPNGNPPELLKGKTIIRRSYNRTINKGTGEEKVVGTFVVVDNDIDKNCQIRVWCSCSSYYWTFQYYNVQKDVDIFGNLPEKYSHKTKRGLEAFQKNKPIRNPGRHPGMCKHIMLLLAMLMDVGTVSGIGNVAKQYKANISRFMKAEKLDDTGFRQLLGKFKREMKKLESSRKVNSAPGYGATPKANKNKSSYKGWNRGLKWNPNTGHKRK